MAFSDKALLTLEFDKIKEMLAVVCSTEGAKAMALALMPSTDFDTVKGRLTHTSDAKRLINAKGYPTFSAPESTVPAADRRGQILLRLRRKV